MTNTATITEKTLTVGMKIRLPSRKTALTVSTVVDLDKYPNARKYITASYGLTGARGAAYKLDRRTDGRWFMLSMGSLNSKTEWYVDGDIVSVG